MRGGEKCLEAIAEIFPQSTLYALFCEPDKISPALASHPVRTSFVQRLPGVRKHYRNYLPFFPAAVGSFDLKGVDLVISTSHCVAKGIKKPAGAKHVSYCFTPMRYAWGFFDEYFGDRNPLARKGIGAAVGFLRSWDKASSARVDRFIAISRHVEARIRRCYGRESDVIYPPADTDFYTPTEDLREDYHLVVSALVPYKRVDLAVRAFSAAGKKLVVIGSGPEEARLKRLAGPTVQFLGWQSDESLRAHYRRAKALIFPGEEDFGIVPVEAQACGCPVIAYAQGGALETVVEGKTGLFFHRLEETALMDAVRKGEAAVFSAQATRANAERFGRERFKKEIRSVIDSVLNERAAA